MLNPLAPQGSYAPMLPDQTVPVGLAEFVEGVVGAEFFIHAGQAACSYSCRTPVGTLLPVAIHDRRSDIFCPGWDDFGTS